MVIKHFGHSLPLVVFVELIHVELSRKTGYVRHIIIPGQNFIHKFVAVDNCEATVLIVGVPPHYMIRRLIIDQVVQFIEEFIIQVLDVIPFGF